jgi:uncharacterized protein YeaO (DUF488 family)
VCDPPGIADVYRILVERLWPRRGIKGTAKADRWVKDAGASPGLRTWSGLDPLKGEEFLRRYLREIRPAVIRELADAIHTHDRVTFLFAAHDAKHHNAMALKGIPKNRGTHRDPRERAGRCPPVVLRMDYRKPSLFS